MLSHHNSHISDALKGLRGGVVIATFFLALAILLQISTWTAVTFTDLRWIRLSPEHGTTPVIINMPTDENPFGWPKEASVDDGSGAKLVRSHPPSLASDAGRDPNVVASRYDVWFGLLHELGFFLGLCGTLLLCVELFLAVCIAAVSDAPGIGRLAHAQFLSMVLLALAFPWFLVAPDAPYPGVFTRYATLAHESQAYLSQASQAISGGMYYLRYVLVPVTVFAALTRVIWNFYVGTITTIMHGPSEFELAIEAEAGSRRAGSVHVSGRAATAFRSAVGSSLQLTQDGSTFTGPIDATSEQPRRVI